MRGFKKKTSATIKITRHIISLHREYYRLFLRDNTSFLPYINKHRSRSKPATFPYKSCPWEQRKERKRTNQLFLQRTWNYAISHKMQNRYASFIIFVHVLPFSCRGEDETTKIIIGCRGITRTRVFALLSAGEFRTKNKRYERRRCRKKETMQGRGEYGWKTEKNKGWKAESEKGTDREDVKGGTCIEYRVSKIDVCAHVVTMDARLFDFVKVFIVCVCVRNTWRLSRSLIKC